MKNRLPKNAPDDWKDREEFLLDIIDILKREKDELDAVCTERLLKIYELENGQ